MTSIEKISASTSQSVDFVKKDLQKMIKKKFFANAAIAEASNEIVIGGKTTSVTTGICRESDTNCSTIGIRNAPTTGTNIDVVLPF